MLKHLHICRAIQGRNEMTPRMRSQVEQLAIQLLPVVYLCAQCAHKLRGKSRCHTWSAHMETSMHGGLIMIAFQPKQTETSPKLRLHASWKCQRTYENHYQLLSLSSCRALTSAMLKRPLMIIHDILSPSLSGSGDAKAKPNKFC